MYINSYYVSLTRPKVNFKANNEEFPKEKDLLNEARKGTLNPNYVDNETGETLFQTLIKNNYVSVVSYITAKPALRDSVINFSANGISPLDYAYSEEMKSLLIARGAKSLPKTEQQGNNNKINNTNAIDAREAAAKIYVENPIKIQEKDVLNNEQIAETYSNTTNNYQDLNNVESRIDYFDAFDEVEDYETSQNIETEQDNINVETNTETNTNLDTKDETNGNNTSNTLDNEKIEKSEMQGIPNTYSSYTKIENDSLNFDNIVGMQNLKDYFKQNVIIPLTEKAANATLKANNIDIPNGILIETNENITEFIKAVSGETGMPILQAFSHQEIKPMLTDIENNYKKNGTKTIILIRNFDSLLSTNNQPNTNSLSNSENNLMLNIENCSARGALIIATTNDKCQINPKFIRAGVFDKVLNSKNPTLEDRKRFLIEYFSDKHLFSNLKEAADEIATKTDNFTYADIEKVLNEAARKAVSKGDSVVKLDDFEQELENFTKETDKLPINDDNKTAIYDTPEFKRVPISENEIMKLDDLGGLVDVKNQLKKLYIEPFKHIEELKDQLGNNAIPDGAIFYGPAGNGKTFTARVLARELGIPYYETKLSDVASSYIHEVSKNIRKMAKQLNDKYEATGEMSLWFFDEFDSLGEARGNGTASHKQEVTDTLLQEFNNPSTNGFILIAATNDLDAIDPALKRRGRLGNWIAFSNPNKNEISDIVSKNLAQTPFTQNLCQDNDFIDQVVNELDGASISSIVSVLTDAKRSAILSKVDLNTCIKKAFDEYTKRQMGEFCNKAGLKQHQYNEYDFKNLDELGGLTEVKEKLQDNVIDVWTPEIRAALLANRRTLPGGVILEGPAGTGKTTIIETLARQMDIPLFKMNYAQEGNEYIHKVSKNVIDIFERLALQAKIIKKPIMLFFDEAEKFFPRYAKGHQIEEVNTYKELMNNASSKNIILVGATNHIDMVNQEIIGNPRRMGTIIHVGNPEENDRENLFNKLLLGLPILAAPLAPQAIKKLAKISAGLSIGQIADNLDKLIVKAVKRKQNITEEQLIEAFKNRQNICASNL